MVLFAFIAALAGLFLLFLFLITLVLLVLAFGPVEVLVRLMMLSFVVFVGSIAAFLYARTNISSDAYRKINNALEQAEDSPKKEGSMSEKEAIEERKHQYAAGNLDDCELEQALDDALTGDNPAEVVERYTENDRAMERG